MTAILIVGLALAALGLLSLVHRAQEVEDQLEKARHEVATRLPQGVSQVQDAAKSALATVRAHAQRVRLRSESAESVACMRGYETAACLAWRGMAKPREASVEQHPADAPIVREDTSRRVSAKSSGPTRRVRRAVKAPTLDRPPTVKMLRPSNFALQEVNASASQEAATPNAWPQTGLQTVRAAKNRSEAPKKIADAVRSEGSAALGAHKPRSREEVRTEPTAAEVSPKPQLTQVPKRSESQQPQTMGVQPGDAQQPQTMLAQPVCVGSKRAEPQQPVRVEEPTDEPETVQTQEPTDAERLPETVQTQEPTDAEQLPETVQMQEPTDAEQLSEQPPETVQIQEPTDAEQLPETVQTQEPTDAEPSPETVQRQEPADPERLSEQPPETVQIQDLPATEQPPQTAADFVAQLQMPVYTGATWPQADLDYAALWASVLHGVADMGMFLQARYARMLEPGAQTGVATRGDLCHAIDQSGPLQLSALLRTNAEGLTLLSLAPYLDGNTMHVVRIEKVDEGTQGFEATLVGQLGTNFIRFVDSLYMPNRGTYELGDLGVFAIGGVVSELQLASAGAHETGLEGLRQVDNELPKTRFWGVVLGVEEHVFYGIPLLRYRLSLAGGGRSLSLVAHPYMGPREIEIGEVVTGEAWLIGHRPEVFSDVVYACNEAIDGTPATAFTYAEALCTAHQVALAECPAYCRYLLEQLCAVVGRNPEVRGIVGLLARALGELRMQAEDAGGTAALDRHVDLLSRLRRSFPELSILEVAIRLARGSGGEGGNFVREPDERVSFHDLTS